MINETFGGFLLVAAIIIGAVVLIEKVFAVILYFQPKKEVVPISKPKVAVQPEYKDVMIYNYEAQLDYRKPVYESSGKVNAA